VTSHLSVSSECPLLARLGPAVGSAIRSLWDGQRTLRKPYSTSPIYEYALTKGPDGAPVSKYPAPHFESPAFGEDPHTGDRHGASRRAGPASPGDTLTLTTWRERNRHALREFSARAPADALGVKQEIENALAQDRTPTK
jgi:hypothetical protein